MQLAFYVAAAVALYSTLRVVSGSNPSFEALSGALSGIARGAAVSIKGKAYTVVRIDPAREGMTLLELEQQ